MNKGKLDAVVVGSGPNGLAAAIRLAQAGKRVLVREAELSIGGAARSGELTLPGFVHDLCSAVHPLAVGSPFFRTLPLSKYGLEWIQPPAPLAHPFDDGVLLMDRSIEQTAARLGADENAYRKLFTCFVEHWDALFHDALGPLRFPRHPLFLARFGVRAVRSAEGLARGCFATPQARALLAGHAAHSMIPLDKSPSAGIALVLSIAAHAVGWPIPRGGSQSIADALGAHFKSLGGTIETGMPVTSLRELPEAHIVLFDLTPRQILKICGEALSPGTRQGLERYRYGPGAFKLDWALNAPIPWRNRECARAATVHLCGTLEEIALSERAAWEGRHADAPYVLLAQPSLFDASRAPVGKHTAWAYCHVPHASDFDMTSRIEAQIERFAPGFGQTILKRAVSPPSVLEARNANLVGGDIGGGVSDLGQLFFRPLTRANPYRLSGSRGLYICSSSSPPGAGVHGLCGYFAAEAALASF